MAVETGVVVLLALSLVGALQSATQDCGELDIVVRNKSIELVYSCGTETGGTLSTTVFVKPGNDFQGAAVVGWRGRDLYLVGWLPNSQCFPNNATWTPLKVKVAKKWGSGINYNYYYYIFTLELGECTKKEYGIWLYYDEQIITNLMVVAYGSSSWRRGMPPPTCPSTEVSVNPTLTPEPHICKKVLRSDTNTSDPAARPPPGTDTPTFPSFCSALLVVAMVVVVALVVVIVVLVVVVCRMRQRAAAAAAAAVASHTVAYRPEASTPAPQRTDTADSGEDMVYDTLSVSRLPVSSEQEEDPYLSPIEPHIYEVIIS